MVGRIGAPHGVRGWVQVKSFTEIPADLTRFADLQLGQPGAWRPAGKVRMQDRSRPGRPRILAHFPGIDDRDAAVALHGQELAIAAEALPETEPGSYYWRDLQGLTAIDAAGVALGRVHSVIDTPAHAVLCLHLSPTLGERLALTAPFEFLVPFVDEFTGAVDLTGGTIEITWPEAFEGPA